MANIRWAATVAALQTETGMANGEAAILAGCFGVGDGGGSTVWFSTFIVASRTITGATNDTPIQITTQAPHGLSTGQRVMIGGSAETQSQTTRGLSRQLAQTPLR